MLGCATRRHGCEQLLDGPRLDESWGELLDPDPRLAKRLLARGLTTRPLRIDRLVQPRNQLAPAAAHSAAARAYRQCLALPHSKETKLAAHNNLHRICFCSDIGMRDGNHYAHRFDENRGTIPSLNAPSALATKDLSTQEDRSC